MAFQIGGPIPIRASTNVLGLRFQTPRALPPCQALQSWSKWSGWAADIKVSFLKLISPNGSKALQALQYDQNVWDADIFNNFKVYFPKLISPNGSKALQFVRVASNVWGAILLQLVSNNRCNFIRSLFLFPPSNHANAIYPQWFSPWNICNPRKQNKYLSYLNTWILEHTQPPRADPIIEKCTPQP